PEAADQGNVLRSRRGAARTGDARVPSAARRLPGRRRRLPARRAPAERHGCRGDAGRHAGAGAMTAPGAVARSLLLFALAAPPVAAQLVADLAATAGPGADVHTRLVDARLDAPDGDGFTPVRFEPAPAPGIELVAGADRAARVGESRWDWSGATALRMHLQNAMAWPVTVQLRVTDAAGGQLDATLGL